MTNKPGNKRYERKNLQKKPGGMASNKPGAGTPQAGIRLNKLIASSGICSRREADDLIKAGAITVNGKIADTLGIKVMPNDDIRYHGKRIRPEKLTYILLNKPKNYITTAEDDRGRKTVMDLIRNACKERVFPVGRLDRNTTGVLLFTNDGELAKQLTHPRHNKMKIYHVQLSKILKKEDFNSILKGFELEDGFISADALSYIDPDNKHHVGIELHSGRNRIVHRIFEHLGYKVVSLDRVYFAGLTKKGVSRGKWRYLQDREISMLKMGIYK